MKGVALNLRQAPRTFEYWERADPLLLGAGQAVSAIQTSAKPTRRGLRRHRAAQRQANNQASDEPRALWDFIAMRAKGEPEYSVQCKKRALEGDVAGDGGRCAAMVSDEAVNSR